MTHHARDITVQQLEKQGVTTLEESRSRRVSLCSISFSRRNTMRRAWVASCVVSLLAARCDAWHDAARAPPLAPSSPRGFKWRRARFTQAPPSRRRAAPPPSSLRGVVGGGGGGGQRGTMLFFGREPLDEFEYGDDDDDKDGDDDEDEEAEEESERLQEDVRDFRARLIASERGIVSEPGDNSWACES